MTRLSSQQLLATLRESVEEISVATLQRSLERSDVTLVDVREQDEWDSGHIPGATHIPRGFLELRIEEIIPDRRRRIAIHCAGGARSLLAARDLQAMGYDNVASVAGGFVAWKRAGYPFKVPDRLSAAQRERYSRHIMLPEVGEAGQLALRRGKVLLLGAGGLGSPAALYLAAAGVGTLGVVDFDVVDATNLQRQIIHKLQDVDKPKVESAARAVAELNPDVEVVGHREQLTSHNALDIIGPYDMVINGSDNFPTRYLVNDACALLGKPLVDGSIYRFEGNVTVFDPAGGGPCYRCVYPEPPNPGEVPSCAEGGVLGVLPGIIGSLQAVEAIKLMLGQGQPLRGRMLRYDALDAAFRSLSVDADPQCPLCGEDASIHELVDYHQFCGSPQAPAAV